MTDRTPASPVEVLTVEQALREAIDYARLSPNGERRKRWEAALQAQDHTITKGGLDEERLAEAMHRRHPESILIDCLRHDRREAADLAREYAALEPTHD